MNVLHQMLMVTSFMLATGSAVCEDTPMRVGIIGLDTSHAPAFTQVFHHPKNNPVLAGFRVVAAYPGGSQDIPSSRDRVKGYTKDMKEKHGVEIVSSIPELLTKVDVVLLESVDGRPHWEQAKPVIQARKPLFIDKPLAGNLGEAVALFMYAEKHQCPMWSSSSLRFSPGIAAARGQGHTGEGTFGKVLGCFATSPCHLDPHHPDFYWYGIHGVETLFTIMGPGCERVSRASSGGSDVATGVWKDGRIGTFRGVREGKPGYDAYVFGSKKNGLAGGFGGYEPLVVEVAKFFRTGKPPVDAAETLEIYAFMTAADESKKRNGAFVSLAEVMEKATADAKMMMIERRSPTKIQ